MKLNRFDRRKPAKNVECFLLLHGVLWVFVQLLIGWLPADRKSKEFFRLAGPNSITRSWRDAGTLRSVAKRSTSISFYLKITNPINFDKVILNEKITTTNIHETCPDFRYHRAGRGFSDGVLACQGLRSSWNRATVLNVQ